jgi:hypothetical protein
MPTFRLVTASAKYGSRKIKSKRRNGGTQALREEAAKSGARGPGMDRTSAGSFRVVGRGMSLKRTCLDWISGRLADA